MYFHSSGSREYFSVKDHSSEKQVLGRRDNYFSRKVLTYMVIQLVTMILSLGNGDGISKLISENTEGSAQAPQLPRKKDKRDFPVGITGIW